MKVARPNSFKGSASRNEETSIPGMLRPSSRGTSSLSASSVTPGSIGHVFVAGIAGNTVVMPSSATKRKSRSRLE